MYWQQIDCMLESRISKVNRSGLFAELQRIEVGDWSLIERIAEERIDSEILRELLLKDEHVVYVAENAMEVRSQQRRGNFWSHQIITRSWNFSDLIVRETDNFRGILRVKLLHDILDVLDLEQQGHVRIKTSLLKKIVMCFLKVREALVILD